MARKNLARLFRNLVSKTVLNCEQLEDRRLLAAVIGNQPYAPNEVLVQYVANVNAAQKAQALGLVRGSVAETIHTKPMQAAGLGQLERVKLGSGMAMQAAINALSKNPFVKYAEPNYINQASVISNDPSYTNGSLWGMESIDSPISVGPSGTTNQFGSAAEQAWNNDIIGSSSVVVGVIDEGIQVTHPDLAGNIWVNPFDPVDGVDNDGNGYVDDVNGWDFVNNDRTVYDGTGDDHATHVAGTIGAKGGNGIGVAGVNWNVTMISAKFLGARGGTTADAIKAVDYLTDLKTRHGINIVASNNSWGGGGYSQGLHDAIIRHAKQNILFVAAAGNSSVNNDATASYPSNYNTTVGTSTQTAATYDGVIAVAAIDSAGGLASFSSYGSATVDIGAPGVSITSTLPSNTYGAYSGTSMATPHVTGAVALYASTQSASTTAASIRSAILNSATPTASLAGKMVTGGRLNVFNALQATAGFIVSTPTPQTTSESGATATFGVRLTKQPSNTNDVTIQVRSSDTTEGTVNVASLVFTSDNWDVVQTVTVTGVPDSVYDGNIAYKVILDPAVSGDAAYNGLDPRDVDLINNNIDPIPPTKFYVVDDAAQNRTYEYAADGSAIENYAVNSGNSTPRGMAMTAAGDRVWVVDANRNVYIYNTSGVLLGSWSAGTLATSANVQGIATDGTNIWIVDSSTDRVFYYANAASRTSGKQTASSFLLTGSGNTNPTDLVFGTDGSIRYLWVVDSGATDRVFRYSVTATGAITAAGNWQLDPENSTPTGIALDPSNGSQDIWVVDSGTDQVYRYADARTLTSPASLTSTDSFALTAGNTNPQGIADPPAMSLMSGASSTSVASTVVGSAAPMITSNSAAVDLLSRTASAQSQAIVRSGTTGAETRQLTVGGTGDRAIQTPSTTRVVAAKGKPVTASSNAAKSTAGAHDAFFANLGDVLGA